LPTFTDSSAVTNHAAWIWLRIDAGILEASVKASTMRSSGFHVPALAELRAAHAENRDLVLDARSHRQPVCMK
jgi:hypothetical protein